MKRRRILIVTHESVVPPEDVAGLSDEQIDEFRMEYDVQSTLQDAGHHVRAIGIGDRLADRLASGGRTSSSTCLTSSPTSPPTITTWSPISSSCARHTRAAIRAA